MLEPGQELLHYRLIEKIGEGGMGVVWKARDTALDRDVAIKVLPDLFVSDADRLARFEREAKLLATLNHPNVAAVYGLHRAGDLRFIAMEYVPGEDLGQRVARGPLPLDDALDVASQIARALDAAHQAGVIHRDLKPANVRITPQGRVKVLDLGLAKALVGEPDSGATDVAASPTLTSHGTAAGVILGTAAYMAPEQARGKAVDRRADLWAFGCVLYEMLSGRAAFGGETVSDTLASILKETPDWSALPAELHSEGRRLLRRCLEKDRERRMRDAGDAALEIEEIRHGVDTPDPAAAAEVVTSRDPGVWRTIALAAGAGAVAGALLWSLAGFGGATKDETGRAIRRLSVTSADGGRIRALRLARDGSALFLEREDGIRLRRLDEYETRSVVAWDRPAGWALSPDGRSLIYFTSTDEILSGGNLRRVSFDTGTTVVLREFPWLLAPHVWQDGVVLAVSERHDVVRLSPETGESETVLETESAWKERIVGIAALPDPDYCLLTVASLGDGRVEVQLLSIPTGERTTLLENASDPLLAANGVLLFLRDDTLIAVRFDESERRVEGEQTPLLADVAAFDLSADGTLAYLPSTGESSNWRVIFVGADGTESRVVASEGNPYHTRYSPDGRMISTIGPELRIHDLQTGSVRMLPFPEGFTRGADHVWTPDSRAVVYSVFDAKGERCLLLRQRIDGRGEPVVLMETSVVDEAVYPTGYAPDGSGLIFARYFEEDTDLWWMPADGSEPTALLATEDAEDIARFSPDGRWVSYESNESGRQDVWIRAFDPDGPRLGAKWQVSTDGGKDPLWSPDGRILYYESVNRRLIAVDVRTPDGDPYALTLGERRVQLDLEALNARSSGDQSYDVAPSGEGFIAVQADARGAEEVRVVLDWLDELDRLVPAGPTKRSSTSR